jgi:hypothetical protein
MIPVDYQMPLAVLLVVGGLMASFAGYRFFRVVLVLYGFVLGALFATSLVGAGNTTQLVVAAIAGGAAGGLILYFGYFVGVALVGAAIGVFVAHAIWAQLGRDPQPLVIILFAIVGATAAMVLQRYVIIIATAFGGAWTLILGTLALTGAGRATKTASSGDVSVIYPFSLPPEDRWLVIVWLVLSIIGILVQLGVTGRGKPRPRRSKARKAQPA